MGDLKERAVFDQYMKGLKKPFLKPVKTTRIWFVIPADKNGLLELAAIQIIIETLEK